jgi:hypothetical protein
VSCFSTRVYIFSTVVNGKSGSKTGKAGRNRAVLFYLFKDGTPKWNPDSSSYPRGAERSANTWSLWMNHKVAVMASVTIEMCPLVMLIGKHQECQRAEKIVGGQVDFENWPCAHGVSSLSCAARIVMGW